MSGWPTAVIASCLLWMYAAAGFRRRHPREAFVNALSAALIAIVPAVIDFAGTQGWRLLVKMDEALALLMRLR